MTETDELLAKVTEAILSDMFTCVKDFLDIASSLKCISFSLFLQSWRKTQMSVLHHCVPQKLYQCDYTQILFMVILRSWNNPIYSPICGDDFRRCQVLTNISLLYFLHSILYTQPTIMYQIRISSRELYELYLGIRYFSCFGFHASDATAIFRNLITCQGFLVSSYSGPQGIIGFNSYKKYLWEINTTKSLTNPKVAHTIDEFIRHFRFQLHVHDLSDLERNRNNFLNENTSFFENLFRTNEENVPIYAGDVFSSPKSNVDHLKLCNFDDILCDRDIKSASLSRIKVGQDLYIERKKAIKSLLLDKLKKKSIRLRDKLLKRIEGKKYIDLDVESESSNILELWSEQNHDEVSPEMSKEGETSVESFEIDEKSLACLTELESMIQSTMSSNDEMDSQNVSVYEESDNLARLQQLESYLSWYEESYEMIKDSSANKSGPKRRREKESKQISVEDDSRTINTSTLTLLEDNLKWFEDNITQLSGPKERKQTKTPSTRPKARTTQSRKSQPKKESNESNVTVKLKKLSPIQLLELLEKATNDVMK